jgi:outer membrane protein assembly complex protein YaeT
MRQLLILLALLAVVAGRPPVLLAADEPWGKRVVSVTLDVEGVQTVEPGLRDLVEVRIGAPLDARSVRESITHLFSLGRFDDVVVSTEPAAGGVAVRFALQPIHSVRRIEFTGSLGIDDERLRRAITDRFGITPSAARTGDVIKVLESLYRDAGFPQARITATTQVKHEPDETTLVINVESGPRIVLRSVKVDGNAPGSLAEARTRLGLSAGQPYDRPKIVARLAEYVRELRTRGYYEAVADHSLTNVSDDKRTADLVVTIDGGPHVTVVFEGDPIPTRVREDLVPIAREGAVDEDLLEDSSRRIAAWFKGQGYRDAAVTHTRTARNGELAIVFRVMRGPAYTVGPVTIVGNHTIATVDLELVMHMRAGDPFVQSRLDSDVNALLDRYHRLGFTAVKIEPSLSNATGQPPLATSITLQIDEGPRTLVGQVDITGNHAIPSEQLRTVLGAKAGQPFYLPQLAVDRDSLLLSYLNRGYRTADVTVAQSFSEDRTRVDITFGIREGPEVFVDHVLIVGNDKTGADTIRREVVLKPGDPLSFEGINESQRKVSSLGLFRRVRITELDHGDDTRRDLLVTVEEAPATSVGYGGGVEVGRRLVRTSADEAPSERFEFAPRGFFEIGRRNLWGRNRSINLFTRLSLRLRSDPVLTRDGVEPATDFNEYRVLATYRQPHLFANSDFVATGYAEQGARTSFDFNRKGARAELVRRLRQNLSLSARYSLERTEVFNESFSSEDQLLIDRLFPQVRLSTISSSLIHDTRDDPVFPTSGGLIGVDGEVAARALGSEVGFVKSFMQGFLYRRLPGRRGIVFATGARVGLAAGFARDVPRLDATGQPVIGSNGEPATETLDSLPASERFFAGGDTTVRGFSQDQLGTPDTLDANGVPLGGNAVVVLNAELRIPVWHDIGAVTFVDAGNVFAKVNDFALGDIRGAMGVGLRYRSPIGPLRFDIGFKLDRQRLPNGQLERPNAFFISLGQAF